MPQLLDVLLLLQPRCSSAHVARRSHSLLMSACFLHSLHPFYRSFPTMDASPSSSSLSSLVPQPQEYHRQPLENVSKKIRTTKVLQDDTRHQHTKTTSDLFRVELGPIVTTPPGSLDALPFHVLREIGAFAAGGGGRLSGASRATLDAFRDVHLKINTVEKYETFRDTKTLLLLIGPTGALQSGRVVVHITVFSLPPWRSQVLWG